MVMDAASYKIIYSEMRASVNRQASEVDAVRGAAARVLGVGAVAMSVVLGVRADESGIDCEALGVSALFLVGLGITVKIWWPRGGWKFDIRATDAIGRMLESNTGETPLTEAEIYRDRALQLERDFDNNEKQLKKLYRALKALLIVIGGLIGTLLFMTI